MPNSAVLIRTVVRVAIAVLFIASGVLHLVAPTVFFAQVPSFLPFPAAIVYVSGVVEIVLGLGLLTRPWRRQAAYAAAVLLVVLFPGNIWQAVAQVDAFGLDTDLRRVVRLLFQPLLIVAVLWGSHIRLTRPIFRSNGANQ